MGRSQALGKMLEEISIEQILTKAEATPLIAIAEEIKQAMAT